MSGEATFIEDFPLEVARGGPPSLAYFTFCYSPVRDESGAVGGFMDTVIETTQSVQARATSKLLNEELAHRVKNTLAMVSGIAAQTLRDRADKTALIAFTDRLVALGEAHSVLVRQNWASAGIAEIIEGVMGLHAEPARVTVDGPLMRLNGQAALSLALITHELATNAIKYGALSSDGGKVAISWKIDETGDSATLELVWRERGGPKVVEPSREGFGSRLIRRGLGGSGSIKLDYAADGFQAIFRSPLENIAAESD